MIHPIYRRFFEALRHGDRGELARSYLRPNEAFFRPYVAFMTHHASVSTQDTLVGALRAAPPHFLSPRTCAYSIGLALRVVGRRGNLSRYAEQ